MYLDAYEIAKVCEDLEGRKERIEMNKIFLRQDESHLFPIRGAFNATKRAIRRVRKFEKEGGYNLTGLEYTLAIDSELSNIVNTLI